MEFLHVDAFIAVLVDSVENSPDEILNLRPRQCTITVGVHDGEHDPHFGTLHHIGPRPAAVLHTSRITIAHLVVLKPWAPVSPIRLGVSVPCCFFLQHLIHHLAHHLTHCLLVLSGFVRRPILGW
ncbi:hypothetical protein [Mesorhizobium sp. B2-7-3]|uniref:hypothetical protein n=1 Tax=Mesorhizobium sp. B2-7-3 TaxID=2589907 RepID=UPI001FEFF123|nr:hypothetical protein [Mesorhizobium sp. B2-7-3]